MAAECKLNKKNLITIVANMFISDLLFFVLLSVATMTRVVQTEMPHIVFITVSDLVSQAKNQNNICMFTSPGHFIFCLFFSFHEHKINHAAMINYLLINISRYAQNITCVSYTLIATCGYEINTFKSFTSLVVKINVITGICTSAIYIFRSNAEIRATSKFKRTHVTIGQFLQLYVPVFFRFNPY